MGSPTLRYYVQITALSLFSGCDDSGQWLDVPLDTASYLYATWLAMYVDGAMDGFSTLRVNECGSHWLRLVSPSYYGSAALGSSDMNS